MDDIWSHLNAWKNQIVTTVDDLFLRVGQTEKQISELSARFEILKNQILKPAADELPPVCPKCMERL